MKSWHKAIIILLVLFILYPSGKRLYERAYGIMNRREVLEETNHPQVTDTSSSHRKEIRFSSSRRSRAVVNTGPAGPMLEPIPNALSEVVRLMQDGDYESAIQQCLAILADASLSTEAAYARYFLAESYFSLSRSYEAALEYEKLIKEYPNSILRKNAENALKYIRRK